MTNSFPANPMLRKGGTHPFSERPFVAIWELTQACDLACVHCRASAVSYRDPRELTTEEGKTLLERIASMCTPLMVLTGGDPAKRPDLVPLVEHGTKVGLTMAVTPSGTGLMQKNILADLKSAGMARVALSIDGPDAVVHDAFRRVNGSFEHTLRILNAAADLGIERQVNTTLGPHNIHLLGEMSELAKDLGVTLWSVFVVVPTGRATSEHLLSAESLETSLEDLALIAETAPFDIKTTAAPFFRRIQLEHRARKNAVGVMQDIDKDGQVRGQRGINDGTGFLFVSHKGEIYPSGFLPISAGNVRTEDIVDIYRSSPLFTKLRDVDAISGKCGVCPFRRICGGSRARAYAMEGDILASDPLCSYVPKQWVVN